MEGLKIERARELAERINASDEWDFQAMTELCNLAGLAGEWDEADGEHFEAVAHKAAKILGVEI